MRTTTTEVMKRKEWEGDGFCLRGGRVRGSCPPHAHRWKQFGQEVNVQSDDSDTNQKFVSGRENKPDGVTRSKVVKIADGD